MIGPITASCAFVVGAAIGGGASILINNEISRIYNYVKCTYFHTERITHAEFEGGTTILQGAPCFPHLDAIAKTGLSLALTYAITPLLLSIPSAPVSLGLVLGIVATSIIIGIADQIFIEVGLHSELSRPAYVIAPCQHLDHTTRHETRFGARIYRKFPLPWNHQSTYLTKNHKNLGFSKSS